MPDWINCRQCSLKHTQRPDGRCPRCGTLLTMPTGQVPTPAPVNATVPVAQPTPMPVPPAPQAPMAPLPQQKPDEARPPIQRTAMRGAEGDMGAFISSVPIWPVVGLFVGAGACFTILAFSTTNVSAWEVLLPMGVVLTAGGFVARGASARLFQYGLRYHNGLWESAVRFDQIRSFTYEYVKTSYNGIPMSQRANFVFEMDNGTRLQGTMPMSKATMVHIDRIRDMAADAVAPRLAAEFSRVGRLVLANKLELWGRGLRFRPERFFGEGPLVEVPYTDPVQISVNNGQLVVLHNGERTASVYCGTNNFYPFLIILQDQLRKARQLN